MSLKEGPSILPPIPSELDVQPTRKQDIESGGLSEIEALREELRKSRISLKKSEQRNRELEATNEQLTKQSERKEIRYRQQIENLEILQDKTLGELAAADANNKRQEALLSILQTTLDCAEKESRDFINANRLLRRELTLLDSGPEAGLAEEINQDSISGLPFERFDNFLLKLKKAEKLVNKLIAFESTLDTTVQNSQSDVGAETIFPEADHLMNSEVIDRLETLEDITRQFQDGKVVSNIANQLEILRGHLVEFLRNHHIEQLELTTGTRLSAWQRSLITVVRAEDLDDPELLKEAQHQTSLGRSNVVIRTIRPGYVYRKDWLDLTLRKAQVVLNS